MMILERTKDEILIRLSAKTDLSGLEDLLDYLKYLEATSSTKAKPSDITKLSKEFNKNISEKYREKMTE